MARTPKSPEPTLDRKIADEIKERLTYLEDAVKEYHLLKRALDVLKGK